MSRGTADNFSHRYLAMLMHGPVHCHEFGAEARLIPDRIRNLALTLPPGYEIVSRWVVVRTKYGRFREKLYELRRP